MDKMPQPKAFRKGVLMESEKVEAAALHCKKSALWPLCVDASNHLKWQNNPGIAMGTCKSSSRPRGASTPCMRVNLQEFSQKVKAMNTSLGVMKKTPTSEVRGKNTPFMGVF
eukprot:1130654-Pelagomonas_calceolata.AAC.4